MSLMCHVLLCLLIKRREVLFLQMIASPTPNIEVSLLKEVDQDPGLAVKPWEGDS